MEMKTHKEVKEKKRDRQTQTSKVIFMKERETFQMSEIDQDFGSNYFLKYKFKNILNFYFIFEISMLKLYGNTEKVKFKINK